MNLNHNPAIVIVAYNRIHSLQRILNSLNMAKCPEGTKLIISIDNNGENQKVAELADHYVWTHGEKDVIYRKERMGLRNHILSCGDFSYKYKSVIILEDDLIVSPYFYIFAREALQYYNDSTEIAGISLYNLPYTEASKLPFVPLKDDSDVYFMQVPSSLGQVWSVDHWDAFKKWYSSNPDLSAIKGLPTIVTKFWSESSWKKFYYGYMVTNNKYFVYPQLSFTSNFNDRGENMYAKSFSGQVNLQMVLANYRFKSINESVNVYDAYSEILPDRLKKLCETLNDYDLEVDLYGQKEFFSKKFVLTSKYCKEKIKGYERAMKPAELNIIYNIPGNELTLARSQDVIFNSQSIVNLILKTMPIEEFINNHNYYYTNVFDTKVLIKILRFRIKNKLKNILKKLIS